MAEDDLEWFEYNTIHRQIDNIFRIQKLLEDLKANQEKSKKFQSKKAQKNLDFAIAGLTLSTNYLEELKNNIDQNV